MLSMAIKNRLFAFNPPFLSWKRRLLIFFISKFFDWIILRKNGGVNRWVLRLLDFNSPSPEFHRFPGGYSSDVVVDDKRNLWFRLFVPDGHEEKSLPIIVFFHGGGFVFLNASTYFYVEFCRRLAVLVPAVVVSVNYRLAPDRFPSQYDDGFDVLCFLEKRHRSLLPPTADVSKCFLSGDSAGANLAHHVVLRFSRHKPKFKSLNVPGLIAIQPFFGGEERTKSEMRLDPGILVTTSRTNTIWKEFLPDGTNRDHPAVNVSGPNAEDISEVEYPATMVVVGGLDPLQDWQRRYCRWLKQSGKKAKLIEYPNMIHAFYVFPELPESSHVIGQVKDFVNTCLDT